MPWNSGGPGPWGETGGSGGPGGNGGQAGRGGPWGRAAAGGNRRPDLDELIAQAQELVRGLLPGGGGRRGSGRRPGASCS